MLLKTTQDFLGALGESLPLVGDNGGVVFMLASDDGVAIDDAGVVVTLHALSYAKSRESIEGIREQAVRLVRTAALPLESTRLATYLLAVEGVVSKASRAELERKVPAAWFDYELLEGPSRSADEMLVALQPEPMARREMIRWLSSGFEFGEPPTSLELWDRRTIYWPPTDDVRELFLYRYEYRPESPSEEPRRGVGLVGSTTFSMYGAEAPQVTGTPEDALAAHCLMELAHENDARAEDGALVVGRRLLGFDARSPD